VLYLSHQFTKVNANKQCRFGVKDSTELSQVKQAEVFSAVTGSRVADGLPAATPAKPFSSWMVAGCDNSNKKIKVSEWEW